MAGDAVGVVVAWLMAGDAEAAVISGPGMLLGMFAFAEWGVVGIDDDETSIAASVSRRRLTPRPVLSFRPRLVAFMSI